VSGGFDRLAARLIERARRLAAERAQPRGAEGWRDACWLWLFFAKD
jgi:hypothetical protein